jgi:hypothetical protein
LEERLKVLRKAKDCVVLVEQDGTIVPEYRNTASLASLIIGRVEAFLPEELDSALIKLHLSKKFGVAKTLCWPPNCFQPAKTEAD